MDHVAFRLPDEEFEVWSEAGVESFVGCTAPLTFFGHSVGTYRVVSARKYEDEHLGPGIWVVVEKVRA